MPQPSTPIHSLQQPTGAIVTEHSVPAAVPLEGAHRSQSSSSGECSSSSKDEDSTPPQQAYPLLAATKREALESLRQALATAADGASQLCGACAENAVALRDGKKNEGLIGNDVHQFITSRKIHHAPADDRPACIWEDTQSGIMVVYKPPHFTCTTSVGGSRLQKWELQSWLVQSNPGIAYLQANPRLAGMVHRLDVETSGPLVVATCATAFQRLSASLRSNSWYKEYVALIHGALPLSRSCGTLEHKLSTSCSETSGTETRVDEVGGKLAQTRFQALKIFRRSHGECSQRYTLCRIQITTGRTHQIRVHLKQLGHELDFPVCGIVSDTKYCKEQSKEDHVFCPRLFLHACLLELDQCCIECGLPEDLQTALRQLVIDEPATTALDQMNKFLLRAPPQLTSSSNEQSTSSRSDAKRPDDMKRRSSRRIVLTEARRPKRLKRR